MKQSVQSDSQSVFADLSHAEAELSVAIDAFTRANRVGFLDFFRRRDDSVSEEVYVRHGLNAIANAERHVATAVRSVDCLPHSEATRGQLGARVRILDTTFRSVMTELNTRPDPTRVVSQLKAARRAIPVGLSRG